MGRFGMSKDLWTDEQRQAVEQFGHQKKTYGAGRRNDIADPRGKHPYFRSTWEANYARYLKLLLRGGRITDWAYEPETFYFEGIKRGTTNYKPDFRVTRGTGLVEYHEVKGHMDRKSQTKINRMAKYHPDIDLVVIDEAAYRKLAEQAKRLVPGWE